MLGITSFPPGVTKSGLWRETCQAGLPNRVEERNGMIPRTQEQEDTLAC